MTITFTNTKKSITATSDHAPTDEQWEAATAAVGFSDIRILRSKEHFEGGYEWVGRVVKEDRHLLPVA